MLRSFPTQLLSKTLVFIALGGEIGRAVTAVVGIFAGPEQAGDGRAILADSNRDRTQQLWLRSMENPGENHRVDADRGRKKSTLAPCSRGIQLCEHEDFPTGPCLLLVRRTLEGFVKVICEVRIWRECKCVGWGDPM